ncbi:MAG TPA: Hpt domain-containing protein [Candidatus Acidoferrales bacterium]|nr:Hpt domain-containing protein [Candidatus Acidoferrales bacterium]
MTDTLDLSNLNEAYDGDRDGIAELLDESLEFIARTQAEMRAALGSADASAVAKSAHSLKGASANIGANAIRAVSAQIESDAKLGELAGVAPLLDQLEAALRALREAVAVYKRGA